MRHYRFSPIRNELQLRKAIEHIHFACHMLCKRSFGKHFPNAGNMGVFCHYDDEYALLTRMREMLAEPSGNPDQKYFRLHNPIVIPARRGVPKTVYTHLYIRKPDPYRHHVGDVDFYVAPERYGKLKQSLREGKVIKGARIFPRQDLDMIEIYDPDVDALGYVSEQSMTRKVRVKQIAKRKVNE